MPLNDKFSKLILGTYQFTKNWGKDIKEKDIYKIFDYALDNGINTIETADAYDNGKIESIIGNYEKKIPYIFTKFGQINNFSAQSAVKDLENSLRRLKRDCIDVYYFHSGNDTDFFNDNLWEKLNLELKKGKINKLGLSLKSSLMQNNKINQVIKMKDYGISVLQVLYNPLFNEAEDKIFPFVKKNNIELITRAPFAKGLISNLDSQSIKKAKENPNKSLKLSNNDIIKKFENTIGNKIKNIKNINSEILSWILKKEVISAVIFGSTSLSQLSENLEFQKKIKNYNNL